MLCSLSLPVAPAISAVPAAASSPATASSASAAKSAASATASAAMTAPTRSASFARGTRLIDDQIPPVEVLAVQSLNSLVRLLIILDLDEAEPAGLPRKTVPDKSYTGRSDTRRREPLGKIILGRLKW